MPDYKKFFEIICKSKLELFNYKDTYLLVIHDQHSNKEIEINLTIDEYDCVRKCFDNVEEREKDSLEKIIADFKKLGWQKTSSCNSNELIFKKKLV